MLRVWNSAPSVDANGPYSANVGDTVTVVATGSDPNPDEKLMYAWQFDPPDGPFTPLDPSPTATFVWARSYNSYIVCVVSDTWPGAVGTYNGPLGGQGIAHVNVTNQPPIALLSFATNSPWAALQSSHVLDVDRIPATNISLRAQISDPDAQPGRLMVEWREDAANPVQRLIGDAVRTNLEIALGPLGVPGEYAFEAVAFDGEARGAPARITITVPGVAVNVVAGEFQAPVPVWGVYSSVNPANTNIFGIHDDTEATRSDFDGWLSLDRAANAQAFVELERTANGDDVRVQYTFTNTLYNGRLRYQTLAFPVKTYPYSARVLGAADADVTMVMHPGVRLDGQCNSEGIFSFGNLVKALPVDNPTSDLHFIVMKQGRKSLCIRKPLFALTGSP
ncbi:hypothetical protein GX586_14465, partial [bacterium]|nr:hypothetical protein [bacterium]